MNEGQDEWTTLRVDASEMPNALRRQLAKNLRGGALSGKFLYQSNEQARRWRALHEAHSPASASSDARAIYDRIFESVASDVRGKRVQLTGLCAGPADKERRLLEFITEGGFPADFMAVDVSIPLLLHATENCKGLAARILPVCADLEQRPRLRTLMREWAERVSTRLFTLFGTLHNFSPTQIAKYLRLLLEPGDVLLISANLASGVDYSKSVEAILEQYDNDATKSWLLAFFEDYGVEPGAGELRIGREDCQEGLPLQRIVARYQFKKSVEMRVGEETIAFGRGDSLRLFSSYRFTPGALEQLLRSSGIEVFAQAIDASGQEGVFSCRLRE